MGRFDKMIIPASLSFSPLQADWILILAPIVCVVSKDLCFMSEGCSHLPIAPTLPTDFNVLISRHLQQFPGWRWAVGGGSQHG